MKIVYRTGLAILMLALAGCASGPGGSIYVPAGQSVPEEKSGAPEPAPVDPGESREQWEGDSPRHQEQADALSPAAESLIRRAEGMLASGNPSGAIGQLERAQRISPRSAEVYYGLANAYAAMDRFSAGEQFARKGLSLAGSHTGLQRQGWKLLASIRRASGNVAGADQAEARAAAL